MTATAGPFGEPEDAGKPLELPEIERGTISGTEVAYRDPNMQLSADIGIEMVEAQDTQFDSDIRLWAMGACATARSRSRAAC